MDYHKICIRSMEKGTYLLNNGFWTHDDGRARTFDSVENALEFIKTDLGGKKRFHVTAFYREKGFLMWHYHYNL